MGRLLIKSTPSASYTSGTTPTSLTFRELGLHNDHMYYGNAAGEPVRLAEYVDVRGNGRLIGINFGPGTTHTYTSTTKDDETVYSTTITAADHGCGDSNDVIVQFTTLNGSVYQGTGLDYDIASSGDITIYSNDSTYAGRIIVSGAFAPNAGATWGSISGDISSQTDLITAFPSLMPAATATTYGIVQLGSDTVQTVAANSVTRSSSRTYAIQNDSSGALVVNVPWANTTYSGSPANGITLNGTVFYARDPSWASYTYADGSIYNFSTGLGSQQQYYTTSTFNSIYLYCSSSTYPKTFVWDVYVSDVSYAYNIIPINSSSSTTTRTYHFLSDSWNNLPPLTVGDHIIYTAKVRSSSYIYWNREVYHAS